MENSGRKTDHAAGFIHDAIKEADPIAIPIRISSDSAEPIYHQIETQLRGMIAGGQLPAGTPLPSIRTLAKDLSCSVITTRRAYQNLEQSGFIETVQGRGTFVAEVATETRNNYRQKAVIESFRKAIETGLQMECTPKEIRHIFETELKKSLTSKRLL